VKKVSRCTAVTPEVDRRARACWQQQLRHGGGMGLMLLFLEKTQDGRELSSRKSHTSFRLARLTAF